MRKLHQEILRNENSFVCEVELTQAGFSVSQISRQIKYEWQAVEEIKETSDSVDIFTRDGGGVIVRNRAFQSPPHRLGLARWQWPFFTSAGCQDLVPPGAGQRGS